MAAVRLDREIEGIRKMSARVLVVDDDDAYRYATVKTLIEAGLDVVEAPDYRQALDILDDKQPLALLVMDVVIPVVNGFALARMARMRHHNLKVIYVSAFDVPTTEAIGAVLRKPVTGDALMVEVRKALADSE
jgi:CheY-like chemotaxis protein